MENFFTITENDSNRRIDRILRKLLPNESLSLIYAELRKGLIKVNGKKVKQSYITQNNDIILIKNLNNADVPKADMGICPNEQSAIDLDVLLRTDDLLFINKKMGQTVQEHNGLNDAVLKYFPPKKPSLSFKPAALHRLDKNTTGILTFSQSIRGAQIFSEALRLNNVGKFYVGLAEGLLNSCMLKSDDGSCTAAVLLSYSKCKNTSLVLYKLITGRKHQIRKHSMQAGHPLVNDKQYGCQISDSSAAYFLHSCLLKFPIGFLHNIPPVIAAPLPKRFIKIIKRSFPNAETCIFENINFCNLIDKAEKKELNLFLNKELCKKDIN